MNTDTPPSDESFHASERLKSRRLIDNLFKKGNRIAVYPITLFWCEEKLHAPFPAQAAVAVSKKNIKKAAQRNKVKRQMRECYRKNKHLLYEHLRKSRSQIALLILYGSKKPPEDFEFLQGKIILSLQRLIEKVGNGQ